MKHCSAKILGRLIFKEQSANSDFSWQSKRVVGASCLFYPRISVKIEYQLRMEKLHG
jgi:hypothetical protein